MERAPNHETISELERRSALVGFVVRVLYSNHIISPPVRDDVLTELHLAQEGTTWACGEPITDEERHNVAAMRVMQDVFDSLVNRRRDPGPVVIWRELAGEEQLYDRADEVFQFVGLDQAGPIDMPTVLAADDACSDAEQATPATRAMQEVWLQRGTATETLCDSDGQETAEEVPFYRQYISTQEGAHDFLLALLDDVQTLDLKLRV